MARASKGQFIVLAQAGRESAMAAVRVGRRFPCRVVLPVSTPTIKMRLPQPGFLLRSRHQSNAAGVTARRLPIAVPQSVFKRRAGCVRARLDYESANLSGACHQTQTQSVKS